MIKTITSILRGLTARRRSTARAWARKTLVVGPAQPVDGDSVACTAALLDHLRKQGREAYTLPMLAMYRQIDWILSREDVHPACHSMTADDLTTKSLQEAYDAVIAEWRPDEVVLVDGVDQGFDTRGVKLYKIDHHVSKDGEERDDQDAYLKAAPAAGCLLVDRFEIYEPILAIAILTDTFWFRHSYPAEAVSHMAKLVEHGGLTNELLADYQKRLMVRKDTRILRAIQNSEMKFAAGGDAAFLVLEETDAEIHRGVMAELGYFCRHMCAVRGDGYVSFRTVDERIDLRPLATKYGGGGHKNQAAGNNIDIEDHALLERLFADFVETVEQFGIPEFHR